MEFPHLGEHCSKAECKRLDFLPLKCDACSGLFCSDHISYASHTCKESYKKDNQVPVCPLCNKPIPLMPGEQADAKVGAHIDTDCQSDPARERRKVYTNKCSQKGCKIKELIPVKCDKCHKNFCLKHRHEQDHRCTGFQGSGRGMSQAGAAAMARLGGGSTSRSSATTKPAPAASTPAAPARAQNSIPPGLTEDEALALAMQLSLQESNAANQAESAQTNTEDGNVGADEALARAIHESQLEERRRQQRQQQTVW